VPLVSSWQQKKQPLQHQSNIPLKHFHIAFKVSDFNQEGVDANGLKIPGGFVLAVPLLVEIFGLEDEFTPAGEDFHGVGFLFEVLAHRTKSLVQPVAIGAESVGNEEPANGIHLKTAIDAVPAAIHRLGEKL